MNSEVVDMIADVERAACVTPNFAHELAVRPRDPWVPRFVLEDTLRLRARRGAGTVKIDSLLELRELHSEESRRQSSHSDDRRYWLH